MKLKEPLEAMMKKKLSPKIESNQKIVKKKRAKKIMMKIMKMLMTKKKRMTEK
jgi:hypothetical protein